MANSRYSPVTVLDRSHDRDDFDCGSLPLNEYLRKFAWQNQKRGVVRNYVVTRFVSHKVIGYYSLAFASIPQKLLPSEAVKGMGRYDVPAMLLARLAVDNSEQGKGLGSALLSDAALRAMNAAAIAGLKFLIVDGKDQPAADFYRKYGFVPLPANPLRLIQPVGLTS